MGRKVDARIGLWEYKQEAAEGMEEAVRRFGFSLVRV